MIVVLGAGYAGLVAATRLACQGVPVTLVNASPRFVERPRLHQVAAGQDVPVHSLDSLVGNRAVRLVIGRVTSVDVDERFVMVDGQRLDYSTLVYALGSTIDLSVPGVREHAVTLSGPVQARRFADRLASLESIAVCGGGLTGIEVATELAEAHPHLRVSLISRDTPGSWLSPRAQAHVSAAFDRLGVEVLTGAVTSIGADCLTLTGGSQVPFDACVWAGGFRITNLATGIAVNNRDRILVDEHLRSISHPDVYAIGDAAAASGPWGDSMAYGCRTGGFMGPYVADAIAGRTSKPFAFRYIHQCISLGRRDAVIQFVNGTDESPRRAVLKGRLAVAYKNIVLGSAVRLFRHPGPYLPLARRRTSRSRASLQASSVRSSQLG